MGIERKTFVGVSARHVEDLADLSVGMRESGNAAVAARGQSSAVAHTGRTIAGDLNIERPGATRLLKDDRTARVSFAISGRIKSQA